MESSTAVGRIADLVALQSKDPGAVPLLVLWMREFHAERLHLAAEVVATAIGRVRTKEGLAGLMAHLEEIDRHADTRQWDRILVALTQSGNETPRTAPVTHSCRFSAQRAAIQEPEVRLWLQTRIREISRDNERTPGVGSHYSRAITALGMGRIDDQTARWLISEAESHRSPVYGSHVLHSLSLSVHAETHQYMVTRLAEGKDPPSFTRLLVTGVSRGKTDARTVERLVTILKGWKTRPKLAVEVLRGIQMWNGPVETARAVEPGVAAILFDAATPSRMRLLAASVFRHCLCRHDPAGFTRGANRLLRGEVEAPGIRAEILGAADYMDFSGLDTVRLLLESDRVSAQEKSALIRATRTAYERIPSEEFRKAWAEMAGSPRIPADIRQRLDPLQEAR